jgi:ankyrin repeat protein
MKFLSAIFLVILSASTGFTAENCTTPLNDAVVIQDINEVQSLLSSGSNVNEQDCNGKTPLINAAVKPSLPILKLLLSNGGDPNLRDISTRTALMFAVDSGNLAALTELANWETTKLDLSSNFYNIGDNKHVYYCTENNCTALYVAAFNTKFKKKRTFGTKATLELIKAGAKLGLLNMSPLYRLVANDSDEMISFIETLRAINQDVDFQPFLFRNYEDAALLDYGMKVLKLNLNMAGPFGTPLCNLIDSVSPIYAKDALVVFKRLLAYGANPKSTCYIGNSTWEAQPIARLIHHAWMFHDPAIVYSMMKGFFESLPGGWAKLDPKLQEDLIYYTKKMDGFGDATQIAAFFDLYRKFGGPR